MKTRMLFLSPLFSAIIFALMMSCSGNKSEKDTSHTDHSHGEDTSDSASQASKPQFDVPQDFQRQLANVFASYVVLKEAFVSSDPAKVKSEAATISQAVGEVDMKLLSGPAHSDWMAFLTPINNSLKEIAVSSDLEVQRRAFSLLSDNLYKSIKAFGLGGKEAVYEYCPMAFDNEGAYWLSDSEQIRNPYFGDKMLTCGEVRERLR